MVAARALERGGQEAWFKVEVVMLSSVATEVRRSGLCAAEGCGTERGASCKRLTIGEMAAFGGLGGLWRRCSGFFFPAATPPSGYVLMLIQAWKATSG